MCSRPRAVLASVSSVHDRCHISCAVHHSVLSYLSVASPPVIMYSSRLALASSSSPYILRAAHRITPHTRITATQQHIGNDVRITCQHMHNRAGDACHDVHKLYTAHRCMSPCMPVMLCAVHVFLCFSCPSSLPFPHVPPSSHRLHALHASHHRSTHKGSCRAQIVEGEIHRECGMLCHGCVMG